MNPFAVVRSIFHYTGYFKNDKNPLHFPLNHLLSLIFWVGTWYYSLPALFYFAFTARTFLKCYESFYFIVDGFLFVIVWPIFLFYKSKIYQVIDDYEHMMQTRNFLLEFGQQKIFVIFNFLVFILGIEVSRVRNHFDGNCGNSASISASLRYSLWRHFYSLECAHLQSLLLPILMFTRKKSNAINRIELVQKFKALIKFQGDFKQ